ncbi:MAG: multiheme c-type cytochrome [Planctomycetota bacterium]|nr:multiheme c-type cytochrome [Planctomycetota bacterium]
MTYLNSLQAEGLTPFVVDGGDWLFSLGRLHPNPLLQKQMLEKGKLLIDAYNRFGTAATALGEHDLALGLDTLQQLVQRMNFPMLCANMTVADGSSPFAASTIIESQGRKVLVVGALRVPPDRFIDKHCPGASFSDPFEAIRKEVEAKRDSVDLCVVLGHINRADVERLASEVAGIDVVVEPNSNNGSENTWINDDIKQTLHSGTVLLKPSGQGSELARADLWLRQAHQPWVSIWNEEAPAGSNIADLTIASLAPHIGRHPGMERIVQQFLKSTRYRAPEAGELDFHASTNFLGATTCAACHPAQTEFWKKTGHGRAYATLEATGDQFRYDCMPCHVTGYGETFVDAHKPGRWKDVQCETCHGQNPRHPTNPFGYPWPGVQDTSCWSCHNPSETRVSFDPKEAIPRIACPPLKRSEGK